MPSSSALRDALIGRRSYEDPEVLMEGDIILGVDPAAAQQYISHTRNNLVANFKSSYAKMVAIEQRAFGRLLLRQVGTDSGGGSCPTAKS